jgi:hypothetical protein
VNVASVCPSFFLLPRQQPEIISPIMADSAPRLEPFVLLARSTQAAATAKVIMDATAAVSSIRS